jgi:hypothetical protein
MEGYYKELYELFGMLDTFLTGWGDKPPSSKGLSLWDLGSDQVNSLKYD